MRAIGRGAFISVLSSVLQCASIYAESEAVCKPDGPVLSDHAGNPIWLSTRELLHNSVHCEAPHFPALFRQAKIDGFVVVDILVDGYGHVTCAHVVSGHPMLIAAAVDGEELGL